MVRQLKIQATLPAVLPHGPLQEQCEPFDPLVEMYRTAEQNYADLTKRTLAILQGLTGQDADAKSKEGQWADGPTFVWKDLNSPKANDKVKSNPVSRVWSRTASWLRVVKANSSAKTRQGCGVEAAQLRPPAERLRSTPHGRSSGLQSLEGDVQRGSALVHGVG